MKKLIISIVSLAAVLGLSTATMAPVDAAACDKPNSSACKALGGANKTTDPDDRKKTVPGAFKTVVNILLFVIGAVSVIMIVIGGIRYVTSNGESSALTSAKNTILYAIVGLVVAIFSYAIVGFVLKQFA